MEIISFLFSSGYLLFTFSASLGVILGFISLFGVDIDEDADFDVDDIGIQHTLLDLLGFGKVPALLTLTLLLGSFGLLGILIQNIFVSFLFTLPWFIVAVPALVGASIITRSVAALIAKHVPNYESYVSNLADFLGSSAVVTIGADAGKVGEAKVVDSMNTTHYVRVMFSVKAAVGDMVVLSEYDSETNLFKSYKE